MSNKKYILGCISVALVIVAIIAKGSDTSDSNSPVKVGVIIPLTGNFAVIGERIKNGFELAREDLIKSGAAPLDVQYEDGCLPKEYIPAVTKLIESDKIDILGGTYCIPGFLAAVPILEKAQVVAMNLTPNPDAILNHKYIISTNTSIQLKADELGKFAANTLKAKTAAIIYYNTQLGEDYRKYFQKSFESLGGNIVSTEMTSVEQTDFRTELAKVKVAKPDVVFLVQLTKPLANLLKEAKEIGISSRILGNSQQEDPSVVVIAGSAAEGFLVSSDDPLPVSSRVEDFNTRYQLKYGQDANVFARNAYDALMLESAAYAKCGKANNECLLQYFHSLKDHHGVSGIITIQPDGTSFKGTSFKVVKDGKFVPYGVN